MSLRDELQRPHVRALLIGGGVILLLAIALYFATKKKTDPLAASTPNGLNADASGAVPTVLVLPPPIIFGPPSLPPTEAPTAGGNLILPGQGGPTGIASQPTGGMLSLPGQGGPTGILSQPPIGLPAPTPPPTLPGLTGPTGLHS